MNRGRWNDVIFAHSIPQLRLLDWLLEELIYAFLRAEIGEALYIVCTADEEDWHHHLVQNFRVFA